MNPIPSTPKRAPRGARHASLAIGTVMLTLAASAAAADDDDASAGTPSPLAALEAALEDADDDRLAALLDEAAAVDLARALELAARHEGGHGVVAGRWRPEDTAIGATFATALNAPPSQYRDHLVLGLLHQWVRSAPRDAERAVRSLPDGPQRADLVEQFQLALLRFRPELALASALADEGTPDAIDLRDAALALARSDRTAAQEALARVPKERAASRTVIAGALTRIWAAEAPADAARWAATLPLEEERAAALEESVYAWSGQAPETAGAWVATLDPGPARDAALQAAVFQAAPDHPELAFQWAQLVADPDLREACLGTATFAWSEADADAARTAVAESPLTESEKSALHAILATPGS